MSTTRNCYVCIVHTKTEDPASVMGPMSERSADKVCGGASINLNHDAYHIEVVQEADLPEGWKELAES